MLEVKSIYKSFGGVHAVDGCSFTIREGTITGLIGPNGAGKTTIFNLIAGALIRDEGQILLDGEDISTLPAHKRFHKGIVRTFQIPHEFSRMTVRENLLMVPAAQPGESLLQSWFAWHKVKAHEAEILTRAEEVLKFLNLFHVAGEAAGNLSGGQKKLLELGRAMMTKPRLVLLDEPGAGVNPTLLLELGKMILRLREEQGYNFCIIEHNMDMIARLCAPIIVMAEGKVLMEGTMQEIRQNHQVREAYLGGEVEHAAS
ncbi:MAG: ABC transporter ATP-binding protein [Alphaproteobacteria bacterium]